MEKGGFGFPFLVPLLLINGGISQFSMLSASGSPAGGIRSVSDFLKIFNETVTSVSEEKQRREETGFPPPPPAFDFSEFDKLREQDEHEQLEVNRVIK